MEDLYTIGVDPDSSKHGVAIFKNGELVALYSLTLLDFQDWLLDRFPNGFDGVMVHMEDNVSVSAAYRAQSKKGTLAVKLKLAQHVGMLKQSQIELERLFERLGITLVKRKPSSHWKKGRESLEQATGWTGRSNEDERSAAYFGFTGARERRLEARAK